ncbi:MAG TPA: hypothetical protein VGW75_04905 [Solirubrobacteraceae bacterium]|jgi:hypothetical protein|nr:hypothetical protein [Solirubrobacteraceae bacterium]
MRRGSLWVALTLVAAGIAPAPALADAPPNDNRANAQTVTPPATVDGTTVDATAEPNEEESRCEPAPGSVWYRVTSQREGRLVVELAANGDLDAVVDVYRARRSELEAIDCDPTDRRGRASVAVEVGPNETFLVRVARQADSVADTFQLTLQFGRPLAEPPGPRLPAGGATGSLHRATAPNAAYSVRLRAGVTYKFNLASGSCTPLALYPPGTDSFEDAAPVQSASCGGYMVFTPEADEGGIYSLLAIASRARQATRYRLMAARARGDDLAPGRFIRNHQRVRGSLDAARIDVVDLYRFDVTRRSDTELDLDTEHNFRVVLLSAGGRRLARGQGGLTRRLRPGRYFAVVRAGRRATGAYRLTRTSRAITRTRALVEGRRRATIAPGAVATLTAQVAPGAAGPVTLDLERFDPLAGWQFARRYRVRASGGVANVAFRPPSVGRWRFRARFRGTRDASPSRSGLAYLTVQGPLQE